MALLLLLLLLHLCVVSRLISQCSHTASTERKTLKDRNVLCSALCLFFFSTSLFLFLVLTPTPCLGGLSVVAWIRFRYEPSLLPPSHSCLKLGDSWPHGSVSKLKLWSLHLKLQTQTGSFSCCSLPRSTSCLQRLTWAREEGFKHKLSTQPLIYAVHTTTQKP